MRVVIGGASGLIGSELGRRLEHAGDEVVRLVRHAPLGRGQVTWQPEAGVLDPAALAGADAVVNLSGASLSRLPWTPGYRRLIVESRLSATNTIVHALGELHERGERMPALISASAVGFYGSRPGEQLDELSATGTGFLAELVRRWEDAAAAAPTRVVFLRTGIVLAGEGALGPILALAKAGLAGPLGSGRQHWPWISLHDEVGAVLHAIRSELAGPVNLVAPTPATAAELIRSVARAVHRPYWLPAPAFALTTVLGDAARELMLADQLVRPAVLTREGFAFRHATADSAIAELLGRPAGTTYQA
ncbi:TIGR01777 family oxidoreductase [Gryllotalpicola reticulitermitis]|uniref:TIGR01777 family oxidoreductase n=1 Tax=Gryllotalpicola reticulitermitis TaxID=1184153 RepID=A0ABV8Q2E7_9MICO